MAKNRTKADRQEYIEVFWGINPRTKSVESVHRQRDGLLSKMSSDGTIRSHPVLPGRMAQSEIVIVFGLTDVFGVSVAMAESASVKQRVADLEAKVAKTMDDLEKSD